MGTGPTQWLFEEVGKAQFRLADPMLRQLNTVLQQPPRARHKPKHPFAKLHHSEEEHLAVSTDADLVYVYLGRTAAKLNVSEERLRVNLLSLQGAYLETNRDGLSVALAKSVAEESGLSHMSCQPTMVPRARSVTPYHLGARSPRVYQGTPRTKVEERAPHIPVRWKKTTDTHPWRRVLRICWRCAGTKHAAEAIDVRFGVDTTIHAERE